MKLVAMAGEGWVYWTGRAWSSEKVKAKQYTTDRGVAIAHTRIMKDKKKLQEAGIEYRGHGYWVEVW